MRILVTGSNGFIAKNLAVRLGEAGHRDLMGITRGQPPAALRAAVAEANFVYHLAGTNRPQREEEFTSGNVGFTQELCEALAASDRRPPVVYSSSAQALLDNPYGRSKRAAEEVLLRHAERTGVAVRIFRLTNVFGKWARPNYNSAVATFCHQIAAGKSPTVHDPGARLRLTYVDDVIEAFLRLLAVPLAGAAYADVDPVYDTTVGEVAAILQGFKESRNTLVTPGVGHGLRRALHATYLSSLPPGAFSYMVPRHSDPRGDFVEMLKTQDSGQFSYFTAHPGVTRGGHYHHSKTEKFLVLAGTARFRFCHILTGESSEILARGGDGRIVETPPGWAHDVTNIGEDNLIVMLWANEIFDKGRPDTYPRKVNP
jgi:UDP-2-acetamido-2,6-beta-L-arabino-hexul-4-ose reductase